MDPILSYLEEQRAGMIDLCRELVECESPSGDAAAIERFTDLICSKVNGIADVRRLPGGHLQCEFDLPGGPKDGQILALGHSDTVWPIGTLAKMPFREADGRLWGPGVLDMKGGIVFLIFAVRALRELNIAVRRRLVLQLNADEETGSDSSRPLTEEEARRSVAVLVLEPGTGLDGKLKTARKGVGDYRITIHGKSAHAGLDFASGVNAALELARQLQKIARFTNLERGVTVSPGVIAGGTRSNVVPDEAHAEIDARVIRMKDAAALDRKFRALKPVDSRCRIGITGGMNRPPMERTAGVAALYEKAQALAAELGIALEESLSGGGSDGNFTAAVGAATLDGIGPVGEGAHAPHESLLVDRMADRAALIAKLIVAI